jgi:putative hydrolase of the HAD superfamily
MPSGFESPPLDAPGMNAQAFKRPAFEAPEALRQELRQYIARRGIRRDLSIEPASALGGYEGLLDKRLPRAPKAIALDVYGTLLAGVQAEPGAVQAASPEGVDLGTTLAALIAEDHARARAQGIAWPEVDGVSVFMRALAVEEEEAARACVAWECAVNPCAPMPGALSFLAACTAAGLNLAIVSNAQFYTPLFLAEAFGRELFGPQGLGLEPDLCFWSYRTGRAKPDAWMYQRLADTLAARGLSPEAVLYIGNDARNDCLAARTAGFMTLLFAGDARSYRPRRGELEPDAPPADSLCLSWRSVSSLLFGTMTKE